ncbi:PEP-CTERM sorting domain-containing protein [Uliginosibacterium sp. H1]|uniref:PEP-CTERM sorting domain-containing protein n=1 Tax=Uliginosibacterium sp. H1 TaxID=3114757 RepID=UPI002E19D04B|nr:PEP-CTERM sorting domain-containing protein [Uliginosibacterium sp. H1]
MRQHAIRLLASAGIMVGAGLPATSVAVPLYQYSYTSGALDEPLGPGAPVSEYTGQRFTISFSTWAPLAAGVLDVADVRANASIGSLSFGFPLPPPATTCVPDPWGPPDAPCIEQPVYPYDESSFNLTVLALDAGGLPTEWSLGFVHIHRYDPRSFDYTYDNFLSDNVAGQLQEHFIYGGALSPGPLAWNISEPGIWRLDVSEVPEPATLLLATLALAIGGWSRRRTHEQADC